MNNNDIIRRIHYIFDFEDSQMFNLFALGGLETDRTTISTWLKTDDGEDQKN